MPALASAFVRLRVDTSGVKGDVEKGFRGAGGAAGARYGKDFSSRAKSSITGGLKDTAKSLGAFLVPAGIGAAVTQIAKIGMAYEDNLNIFQSVSEASKDQMAAVAEKARQLGADVKLPGVSAAGAAAAMTELSKAGFSVSDSMAAAQGTLQLARAAGIDEAKAAEIAANAINTFGIKAGDANFVVDQLAATANSSSIEIGDAADSFKMASAVYSAFQSPVVGAKESITELSTAVAILGNNGIKGSDAGTSLKQMLLQLTAPSEKAKGIMAELAAEAANVNISLDDQKDILYGSKKVRDETLNNLYKTNPQMEKMGDIAYDSSGKMRPLREIIDLVGKATKGMTQEDRNYAISQVFGADATRAVLTLIKGGPAVYDKQRQAVLRSGAAADVAAAKNKGLKGSIDNVQSQFENAAIAIYNKVKGPLTSGLNDFAAKLPGAFATAGDAIQKVAKHSDELKSLAIAIGAVIAITRIWNAVLVVQAAGGLLQWVAATKLGILATRTWTVVSWLANAPMYANIVAQRLSTTTIGTWLGVKALEIGAWLRSTAQSIASTASMAVNRVGYAVASGAVWAWVTAKAAEFVGWVRTTAATIASTAATVAHTVVTKAVQVATIAWTGVQWALNAALNANPIGLVIVAITAFIAIVILAYNKNETFRKIVQAAWAGIKAAISAVGSWITGTLWPSLQRAFGQLQGVFRALGTVASVVWKGISASISFYWGIIKGVFNLLSTAITKTVPDAFRAGVSAISKAWEGVKAAAKLPVTFVVNSVMNPLIKGYNRIAGVFGAPKATEIGGFAEGGRIPGAPSSVDNRLATLTNPLGRALGTLKVATGEYVVNAKDTARALPLLQWINSGMKGGGGRFAQALLGRPMVREPGDGSEGFAFAKGGLVGFMTDVWGALSDPAKLIKGPIESAIKSIPGSGGIRDLMVGLGHKLLDGFMGFVSGGGQGKGGNVGAARSFVQGQAGKPYVWANAGPGGYDCSGIVSAAYNVLKGNNPYSHTFSTESLPGPWFDTGRKIGPLVAGWSHPGQAPASASVGHMAGMIGGLPFESTGSAGVRVGVSARRVNEFANIGAARAQGGLLDNSVVRLLDRGGAWPTGTLGMNASGHTETVLTGGPSGDMAELRDLLSAILVAIKGLGGEVAEALERPTRRALQLGRTGAAGAGGRTA